MKYRKEKQRISMGWGKGNWNREIRKRLNFKRILFKEVPKGGNNRKWICVWNKKGKKSWQGVAGDCIDTELRLGAKLRLKRPRGQKGKHPKEPKIQLQSLRGCLAVIAYRKWDFEILGIEKRTPNSESRIEIAYSRYPGEVESGDGIWRESRGQSIRWGQRK